MPLVVAASPFVARMVEQSLEEIDQGVIEAAACMGATKWQIITRVLITESVPSLVRGFSIVLITILGYTAITGATARAASATSPTASAISAIRPASCTPPSSS